MKKKSRQQSLRVSGLPTDVTFVFSSALQNDRRFDALGRLEVEAVMESFIYIRGSKVKNPFKHATWPFRRYLDSGLFNLMSKAGVVTISTKAKRASPDEVKALANELLERYCTYLKEHHQDWDHILEFDTDRIPALGVPYAREARERLYEIVGNKLLPVWHDLSDDGSRGQKSWRELINKFRYVAISSANKSDVLLLLKIVRQAHKEGVLVHTLGNTNTQRFREVEYDTGDSSNWTAGPRYARYGDIVIPGTKTMEEPFGFYGTSQVSTMKLSPSSAIKVMRMREELRSQGIDVDSLDAAGANTVKFYLGAKEELKKQEALRQWRKRNVRK